MAGFDNDIIYGEGIDLSGSRPSVNQLDTDGYLLIGNSSGNPVGAALTVDPTLQVTNGAGSIQLAFSDNAHTTAIRSFDGSLLEVPDMVVTSDGATITFSIEKSGGGDLTLVFSDDFYTLDCTPAATIALTAGTDTVPVLNYVYIPIATKVLTVSTVSFPVTEHVALARVLCQTAASLQTQGPYMKQKASTEVTDTSDNGHVRHISEWILSQNATWVSGVAPTLTITPQGAAPDNVIFTSTAGVVYELHKLTFPAFAGTPTVYEINNSVTPYQTTADLNSVLTDSTGASLSGKYFSLVIWGVTNENASSCKLMVNRPSGSYTTQAQLVSDPNKYTDFSIPAAFKGTGFLIAQLQLRHTVAAGGTWTAIDTIDLRGLVPSITAGGQTIQNSVFLDNVFRIVDDGDNTKQIAFQASGITTATTRTLTVQDLNGTIALKQTWNATGASTGIVANNGYVCNAGAALVLTLPATASVGDRFEVVLNGSTSWQVAQNAGQQIRLGSVQTTAGAGGSITSTAQGDWIEIICSVADTTFVANVKQGNLTVV